MNVALLSRSPAIPSTGRLVAAAEARGHRVEVLNPAELELHLDSAGARVLRRGRDVGPFAVVIPRIAPSIASYGLPVLDQLERLGAVVMNSAAGIAQSRNPARCLQLLASHGLAIPSTVMAREPKQLKAMVEQLGGVPVLVKLLHGVERRGLMVCESKQSLEAVLEAVLGLGHHLVMQEYVRAAGRDVRVFVVGGRAVAAVARVPSTGRLTRTLARISRLEAIALDGALVRTAERAAAVCALEICAIDVLEGRDGVLKVFEVNASPALVDLEAATKINLADAIIARAEALARTPMSPKESSS